MSNKERFECFIDEWDENDWYIKDNKTDEQFEYLEDVTKLLNRLETKLTEQKLFADNIIKSYVEANKSLGEQVLEKEKEIEQLKKFDDLNKTFFDLFRTAFKEPNKVDDLFNTFKTMQEKQEQDKIEFAITELDKLRQLFIYNYNSEIECIDPYDNNCCLSLSTTLYNTTIEIFNNQIKQLKEGK